MFYKNLKGKIKKVRSSIVAIGFHPNSQQITIIGSGFAVSDDGKILTAAHLYNQLNEEQRNNLRAFVMVEQKQDSLERYRWIPIKLINKVDPDDIALFQLDEYKKTLLKKLGLSDSERVEIGQDAYFIGFPYAAQLMNDGFGVTLIVNKTMVSNIKHDGINPDHKRNWFILDAISNPGNSGCPLIDLKTNRVIGIMTITFRTKSQVQKYSDLDIREPMHICAAKPINLAKSLL
jgi:S1-C subfamily serine protease